MIKEFGQTYRKEIFNAGFLKVAIIAAMFGASLFIFFLLFARSSFSSTSTTYTLSVNSPHGTTYGSGSYPNGTTASFGVSPTTVYSSSGTTRYIFTGWSCSGNGCYSGSNPSASVIMNDDIVENANWLTQYLLATSVTGNGSVNPSGQNWYDAGSIVQVSETPAGGQWIFAYWELDGQNAGSPQTYTVTMNSPHFLVANFIEPEIQSKLVNVTDSYGNNLRNPDGTFYRLDKFELQYDVIIIISGGNGTLPPSVTFDVNLTYPHNVLSEVANGNNYTTFIILPSAPLTPYNITISAFILNSEDGSMRPIPSYGHEPFAVVDYSPHFNHFTYVDYNALNSSTYERPFVVLLRYDGNSPGYSYSGDINTDPFDAMNSTGERAIVNSFAFQTNGWSISSNLGIVNDSIDVMNFVEHPNLSLSVALKNNKAGFPTVITWSNRVQRYFFLASIPEIKNYIDSDSIIYFNVTTSAWYTNAYNSNIYRSSDFNSSYLYEPIFYNGFLVFKPFGGSNADFSVSIVSHNPSPLDSYIVSETFSIFGNDNTVISTLEQDLYPANSTTILKPLVSNSQEWVFLINQTNMATANLDGMPYFTVSVSGKTGYTEYSYQPNNPPYYLSPPVTYYGQGIQNTTYNVYDYFGLFATSDYPSSFPFKELTGYYFMQPSVGEDIVMQPLNFSFSSSMPYLVRTYADPSGPFFVSFEPGNLSQSYSMVYGENRTIFVSPNFVGGGIFGLDGTPIALNGGTSYQVSLLIGNESGGASYVWVVSDRGEVLYNESLTASSSSLTRLFGSAGYVGEYTFQFPVGNSNNSVTIYIENSWGALSIINGVEITPHSPPTLSYSPGFLATILFLAFAISSGYMIFRGKSPRNNS
jgi:hypothetical protein